ncbi:hypothetical protein LTR09_011079 [Extremus antarcticus]|uniref:Uncharacterized protein n=1 Tax=Extremus antarcticus TaxID=702011 RepID=A0AAJ0DCM4_9PEZI|nr:hypothetical protein LTR09_011079 [Extremus antarcticus]
MSSESKGQPIEQRTTEPSQKPVRSSNLFHPLVPTGFGCQPFREPDVEQEDADDYVDDAEDAGCVRKLAWYYWWHILTTTRPGIVTGQTTGVSTGPPKGTVRPSSDFFGTPFRDPDPTRESSEDYARDAVENGCLRAVAIKYWWHIWATERDENGSKPRLRAPMPSTEGLETWLEYARARGYPELAAREWYIDPEASPLPPMQLVPLQPAHESKAQE